MRDHEIELTVPEIELCIDVTEPGQPYEEVCGRADDEIVQRAAEKLIERHSDELETICYELHENRRDESRATPLIDALEDAA